jgi:hypothetical protein
MLSFSSHSNFRFRHGPQRVCCCVFVLVCLSAISASACQVPVFRYALERWVADQYVVLVLSRGALSPLDESVVERLDTVAQATSTIEVKRINLESAPDPQLEKLWQKHAKNNQPLLVALYPKRSALHKQVAHLCELTANNVSQVLDSPRRQEIVEKLINGDSAVWVLVESGDRSKDQLAKDTLEKRLAAEEKLITLPTAQELDVPQQVLDEVKIKLKVGFSIVTLSREDPKEKMLLDCLLHSEPDLAEFSDQPIVFPVFGRGVVLYAIIGKGINAEVIHLACKFLTGPCSCQAKEQNPGFDLPLNFDWNAAVGQPLISQPANTTSPTEPKLLTIPPGKKK